jgi:CRISPR-associated endonuclease Cas2
MIEKIISSYGIRVQKSVFESDMNEQMIYILQKKIEKAVDDNDFVAIIPLCERDWQKAEKYGILLSSQVVTEPFEIL